MTEEVSVARLNPDSGERFQMLRRELEVTTFGINLITLQPGQRGRIHTHAGQEEVFVVMEGILDLVLADTTHELHVGDCARVAPAVRRQLVNRGPGRAVTLALGSANAHESRDGAAYADWAVTESTPPADTPLPEDLSNDDLRS